MKVVVIKKSEDERWYSIGSVHKVKDEINTSEYKRPVYMVVDCELNSSIDVEDCKEFKTRNNERE